MRLLCRLPYALLVLTLTYVMVSVPVSSLARKPAPGNKVDARTAVQAINSLAVDLYPKLKEGDENLFFSPYSISSALAMTYAGARGQTAAQMARTLHFGEDRERLALDFQTLNDRLYLSGKQSDCELNVTNGLWVQKGFPLISEFQTLIFNAYDGRIAELNFGQAPEAARKTINTSVAEQTHGKITDLIPPGSITELTRLVLTNAIYFKGSWFNEFREARTLPGDFTLLDGSKIRVPMMHTTEHYGYVEKPDVQILELEYKGHEFSMIVLLPKAPAGLTRLERTLTSEKLSKLKGQLWQQRVSLWLPKFTIKTPPYQLGQLLAGMGMSAAFGDRADFSGIDGQKNRPLRAVFHKAFVNVDEAGTEAAAAMEGGFDGLLNAPSASKPPVFRADHPFLYVIRHNPTNCILFMGRLTRP